MFNVQALLESLPMMGYGMLGIFIAVAVIITDGGCIRQNFSGKKITIRFIKSRGFSRRAFCIVGLSYKATTSYAGGDKNL